MSADERLRRLLAWRRAASARKASRRLSCRRDAVRSGVSDDAAEPSAAAVRPRTPRPATSPARRICCGRPPSSPTPALHIGNDDFCVGGRVGSAVSRLAGWAARHLVRASKLPCGGLGVRGPDGGDRRGRRRRSNRRGCGSGRCGGQRFGRRGPIRRLGRKTRRVGRVSSSGVRTWPTGASGAFGRPASSLPTSFRAVPSNRRHRPATTSCNRTARRWWSAAGRSRRCCWCRTRPPVCARIRSGRAALGSVRACGGGVHRRAVTLETWARPEAEPEAERSALAGDSIRAGRWGGPAPDRESPGC